MLLRALFVYVLETVCLRSDITLALPSPQRVDVEKETIELVHTNPTETRDLPCRIPSNAPRYHLFLYKHSHQGQHLESLG